jgi:hypothetical protein
VENKFTLEDYIYVPIEPELARKLLEKHEKDWEPFDEFNGFYHCLKQTLEDLIIDLVLKKKSLNFNFGVTKCLNLSNFL